MTTQNSADTPTRLPMRWAPVQIAALAVGAVFLLIGVLGFIPGITADNWLHLGLGAGMLALGLGLSRVHSDTADAGGVSTPRITR